MRVKLHDRNEAGRLLSERLAVLERDPDVVVLALPRGGVPLACAIATSLRLPLDVFQVRKLRVPGYEELAMERSRAAASKLWIRCRGSFPRFT